MLAAIPIRNLSGCHLFLLNTPGSHEEMLNKIIEVYMQEEGCSKRAMRNENSLRSLELLTKYLKGGQTYLHPTSQNSLGILKLKVEKDLPKYDEPEDEEEKDEPEDGNEPPPSGDDRTIDVQKLSECVSSLSEYVGRHGNVWN